MGKIDLLNVQIQTTCGLKEGYIVPSKITSFREHIDDCNRIIVHTENREYTIYMKLNEFKNKMTDFLSGN
jgi:hypothetical protein